MYTVVWIVRVEGFNLILSSEIVLEIIMNFLSIFLLIFVDHARWNIVD